MLENNSNVDELVEYVLEGIDDLKGEEVTLLDLRAIDSAVCDYFVICNGSSNTHVNSIVRSVDKNVKKALQEKPWHIEGMEHGEWVLMDYVDVVVHVFQQHIRDYYDIESLWGDAKAIAVEGN